MAEVNFSLLQPVDVGALTQQGFATGVAMVKHAQTQNALRDYLANPDDPQAYNALAAYDPAAAGQIQTQRYQQRKILQDQQDRERAVSLGQLAASDPGGAQKEALAAGDFDLADHFSKLSDDERTRTLKGFEAAAPIAFKLRQIADPVQRKALFDQARPQLEAAGFTPDKLDQFDVTNDTALDAIIASGQKVSDLIDQGKVVWHQQGEQPSFATDSMGRPIGSQNPYAKGFSGLAQPKGLVTPGNIDIHNRPVARNSDGSISTVRSISIGIDQGEVLIPTVINGKVVNNDEAIAHYRQTGEHLGIFDNAADATAYAQSLHQEQAREYGPRGLRNNNPLNLTDSEFTRAQPGFAGTDSGGRYAKFASPEAGMAAGQHLLGSYLQRGFDTPAEIVERWAPAKENGVSTANYVSYVAKRLGIGAHDPVSQQQIPQLMAAMSEFENGGRSGGQKRAMSVGAAPHVATKAEFDKLPSGTPFVAPDGSHRVKP